MQNLRAYRQQRPQLGNRVYVDPSACVIGQVDLGEDVGIWPMVVIRGDVNAIRIGRRSNIQDGSVLHVTRMTPERPEGHALLIGEEVTVGHKAMLHGCQIRDRVLIGMGAIVLDGALIESEVIVGAGSLVPPGKRLVSGYLYVGSPVRQSRPLSEAERAFLSRSAHHYVLLKDEYLQEAGATA